MAVDHKLVADLESAVAAVQAEVDQCHAAREAYIRAHEVKPPGIGQWRGVVPIDCSIPEQELDRNKRELEDARKGEPSTLPRQGQPSGPPTESAPERSNPTDEAAQQVSKAVDDEKTLAAKRAVQMSDTQVSMDLTAGGLLATGIALNVGGMIPATTGVGLIVTAVAETTGVILDISAVAVFALGSGCQSLGNRFQQIADHPPRQDFQVPLRFNPYPQLPKPQGVTDAILRGFGTQLVLMAVGLGRLVTAVERYEGASQARRHFEGLRVPQMVRYMADRELQQAETSAHIAAACADLADSLLRHEREVQSEWQALRELIQMQGSLEARDPGKELREQLRASWHKYRNEMGQVLDLDTSEQNELDGIVDGMISRLRPQSELPEKLVDGKLADVLRPTALELEQISARFQQLTDSLRTDLGYAPSSKKVVDDLTMRGVPLEPDNAKSDFDAAIRLRTAYWIPERASTGWWGASTETGPAMPDMLVRLGDALLLPPGEYRVYWRQDAQHRPVPLAKGVRVDPGRLLKLMPAPG